MKLECQGAEILRFLETDEVLPTEVVEDTSCFWLVFGNLKSEWVAQKCPYVLINKFGTLIPLSH